jgi:hypothetical protein
MSAPLPPSQIMQHRLCCAFSIRFLALAVLSCLLLGSAAVPLAGGSTPIGDEQLHPEFTLLKPRAPLPIPTPEQLRYQGSMNALVHFGMSTFFHDGDPGCDRENWNGCDPSGGCNSSDTRSFNPSNLNVSNWIQSFNELGVSTAVLTAKHGCGFLAWRTNTTLPDGRLYATPPFLQCIIVTFGQVPVYRL